MTPYSADRINANGRHHGDYPHGDAYEGESAVERLCRDHPGEATDVPERITYNLKKLVADIYRSGLHDVDGIIAAVESHYAPRFDAKTFKSATYYALPAFVKHVILPMQKAGKPKDLRCSCESGYIAGQCPRCDEPQRFKCKLIDSATFAAGDYRPTWLIQRLMVAMQPGVMGGARKCMKTSVLLDIALGMATGTTVLNTFKVYHPVKVALFSGESGEHTLQETANRICEAKKIKLASANLLWGFELPQLSNLQDLALLADTIMAQGIKCLFIDPLYLTLMSGLDADTSSASNLYAMGPLFHRVAKACLSAGCTPWLVHHARKPAKTQRGELEPMDLDDLAFSGIAEFARQWILLSRREKYEPGTGMHELWMTAGGSIGHGGLWAVDIDEGVIDDRFAGRKWQVSVIAPGDVIAEETEAKEDKKAKATETKEKAEATKLLVALDKADPKGEGIGYTDLRALANLRSDAMIRATTRLVAEGIIEYVPDFKATVGNGAKKAAKGIRRRDLTKQPGTSGQHQDIILCPDVEQTSGHPPFRGVSVCLFVRRAERQADEERKTVRMLHMAGRKCNQRKRNVWAPRSSR